MGSPAFGGSTAALGPRLSAPRRPEPARPRPLPAPRAGGSRRGRGFRRARPCLTGSGSRRGARGRFRRLTSRREGEPVPGRCGRRRESGRALSDPHRAVRSPQEKRRSLGRRVNLGRSLMCKALGTRVGRHGPAHTGGVATCRESVGGASGGSPCGFDFDLSQAERASPGAPGRGSRHGAATAQLHCVPALSRGLGAAPGQRGCEGAETSRSAPRSRLCLGGRRRAERILMWY